MLNRTSPKREIKDKEKLVGIKHSFIKDIVWVVDCIEVQIEISGVHDNHDKVVGIEEKVGDS